MAVWPPAENGTNGDCGACEEGYLRYWITGRTDDGVCKSANVTCFFDETGEIWMIHGSVIVSGVYGNTLHPGRLLGGWSKAMRQSLAVFDHFDAFQARRVELGLFGVKGIRWSPPDSESNSPQARKNHFLLQRQSRDWSDAAQISFLAQAYNDVRDLFALPNASEAEVEKILAFWDRDRAVVRSRTA